MGGDIWDFDEDTPVESNRRTGPEPVAECEHCGHMHKLGGVWAETGRCGTPVFGVDGDPCRYRRCTCRGEPLREEVSLDALVWARYPGDQVGVIHVYAPEWATWSLCGLDSTWSDHLAAVSVDLEAELAKLNEPTPPLGPRPCRRCLARVRNVRAGKIKLVRTEWGVRTQPGG